MIERGLLRRPDEKEIVPAVLSNLAIQHFIKEFENRYVKTFERIITLGFPSEPSSALHLEILEVQLRYGSDTTLHEMFEYVAKYRVLVMELCKREHTECPYTRCASCDFPCLARLTVPKWKSGSGPVGWECCWHPAFLQDFSGVLTSGLRASNE